jgi:hypothetical protein
MNSLEDAFINIAREEEKLLANLKKHGVRRLSTVENENKQIVDEENPKVVMTGNEKLMIQNDDDRSSAASSARGHQYDEENKIDPAELKRYHECQRNPSFIRQFWASYRRRLIIFYQDSSQMFLMFGPLMFIIIELLFVTIILNGIYRITK